jgi:HPt (histidine-containing phosphotransfer) domain-containing protein
LLDQKALDNIRAVHREGAPKLLERVINIYFESSPKLLQTLRDAIAGDDAAETIERAAHSLKSSSANLGATRLTALCGDLEKMARENRTEGAKAIVIEIEQLYPLVCESLAAECENDTR